MTVGGYHRVTCLLVSMHGIKGVHESATGIMEKMVGPETSLTILGIQISTLNQTLRISADKLARHMAMIQSWERSDDLHVKRIGPYGTSDTFTLKLFDLADHSYEGC